MSNSCNANDDDGDILFIGFDSPARQSPTKYRTNFSPSPLPKPTKAQHIVQRDNGAVVRRTRSLFRNYVRQQLSLELIGRSRCVRFDNLNDLPAEILLSILSFLSPKDLCTSMSVCQLWNVLANDRFLWKELFICRWGKTSDSYAQDPKICWKTMYSSQLLLLATESPTSAQDTNAYGRKRRREHNGLLLHQDGENDDAGIFDFQAQTPPRNNKRRREEDMTPREKKYYLHDLQLREYFASLDDEPLMVEPAY